MSVRRSRRLIVLSAAIILLAVGTASAQKKGMKTITADELRLHLSIVASDETEGRGTPSAGGNMVARYLAAMAAHAGLKPIMSDGSFFQEIPLNVATVSELRSKLHMKGATGETVFYMPKDFGNMSRAGKAEGDVLFVGCGLQSRENKWDDFANLDLKGKVVVALDGQLPASHAWANNILVRITRQMAPAMAGATAILTVISPEREKELQLQGSEITSNPFVALLEAYATDTMANLKGMMGISQSEIANRLPMRAEIRHAAAAKMLGITEDELASMFTSLAQGRQVPGKPVPSQIELSVEADTHRDRIRNVLAVVEGSDPILKKEYVVISSHYDHLGMRNGRAMTGADDNGSGTVALLEIAQALMAKPPKRSVILAWFAGEERGLWGSHYFVNHCPVPIEAISADLNLDMISRNDPNSLFLVAAKTLTTEIDKVLSAVNDKQSFKIKLDFAYSDKNQAEYYRSSDHYPFIRMGIPSVTLFCGKTPDYHQLTDTIERVDFAKIEKVARFAYAAALEIGNRPGLLKLDVNPKVTARGKQNIEVESIR